MVFSKSRFDEFQLRRGIKLLGRRFGLKTAVPNPSGIEFNMAGIYGLVINLIIHQAKLAPDSFLEVLLTKQIPGPLPQFPSHLSC